MTNEELCYTATELYQFSNSYKSKTEGLRMGMDNGYRIMVRETKSKPNLLTEKWTTSEISAN